MTQFEQFSIGYYIVSGLILIATVYYIAHSPVNAVRIGRTLNNEQQKDNAKRSLFLLLFSLRGSPLHYDFVKGLNEIDIVFEDTPTVLEAWHHHYDSLQIDNQVNENQIWDLQRTEILSAMALSLGYNRIRQTDMIRSYYPKGHEYRDYKEIEIREAQLAYHKSMIDLSLVSKELNEILIDFYSNMPERKDGKPDEPKEQLSDAES